MALHRFALSLAPLMLAGMALPAHAAGAPLLQPFGAEGSAPPAPWHVAGLPGQTKPFTRFDLVDLDGHRALRVRADESYGNLVHPLHLDKPAAHLAWQWRVEQAIEAADLNTKAGDDTALKVCVSFDLALDQVPFVERQLLRIARSKTAEVTSPKSERALSAFAISSNALVVSASRFLSL